MEAFTAPGGSNIICVHFGVSLLALVGLYIIELFVIWMALGVKTVTALSINLGDLMFNLEVIAAVGIIVLGMLEALVVLFLQLILDCVEKAREITKAWRS